MLRSHHNNELLDINIKGFRFPIEIGFVDFTSLFSA